MAENAWGCGKGAMNKSQGKGMRKVNDLTCQGCKTCCGSSSGLQPVSSSCSATCNDSNNCPGRPAGRVVFTTKSKKASLPTATV